METVPSGQAQSVVDERTWIILTHISAFFGVAFPFGSILGPLVLWLIMKPRSELVERHGKMALNFQISVLLYTIVAALSIFILVGLLILPALMIFWTAMTLVATIRVANGREPGYLLSIQFLK